MVAEETKTPSLARVSATPCAPNRMASVCAAVTTTETTIAASLAASAGVAAPRPPAAAKRATAAGSTSQPVTAKPARSSDCAMPNPIDPRPITATRCFAMDVLLRARKGHEAAWGERGQARLPQGRALRFPPQAGGG